VLGFGSPAPKKKGMVEGLEGCPSVVSSGRGDELRSAGHQDDTVPMPGSGWREQAVVIDGSDGGSTGGEEG
jgi:hypothetical protein